MSLRPEPKTLPTPLLNATDQQLRAAIASLEETKTETTDSAVYKNALSAEILIWDRISRLAALSITTDTDAMQAKAEVIQQTKSQFDAVLKTVTTDSDIVGYATKFCSAVDDLIAVAKVLA